MSKLSNSGKLPKGCGLLCCAAFAAGCGFISLEEISVETVPGANREIIAEGEMLSASFSITPDRGSAEKLISISGGTEEVHTDFIWEGNDVYIVPVPPPSPGVPYLFRCTGILHTADGRTFQVDKELFFFYISAEDPPVLLSSSPGDGEDCYGTTPLTFQFNRQVSGESFRNSFAIIPETKYSVEVSESGTQAQGCGVSVAPETAWTPRTGYTWKIKETCTDNGGIPLQCEYTGTFRVQADVAAPSLLELGPVRLIENEYMPQPGFGRGDSLQLLFSEAVDIDSLLRAFSLDPPVYGGWTYTGGGRYVYTPGRPFVMNQRYRITLSRELADPAGNCLRKKVTRFFTPDIPLQEITEIRSIGRETVTASPADTGPAASPVVITLAGPGPGHIQLMEIDFSQPYGTDLQPAISGTVSLRGFFPDSAANPRLEQTVWTNGGRTLRLLYNGFLKSPPEGSPVKFLYKLTIPGGPELSANENGSYLLTDFVLFLESERES